MINNACHAPFNVPRMEPIDRALEIARQRGLNQTQFADLIGATPQDITNWKKRGMPLQWVAKASRSFRVAMDEILYGLPTVFPDPEGPPTRRVAQFLSQAQPTTPLPRLSWEELVNREDLPLEFEVKVLDDSMAPEIAAGNIARFKTDAKPIPGKPVLVADRAGNRYLRTYRPRTPHHWLAEPANPAYAPLDSIADELRVLAVLKGVDWL